MVNHPNGWAAKRSNSNRASGVFETQEQARQLARDLAIKTGGEVTIQGRNGRFRQKNSYGNDPYPPEG